jgi:sortase A
MARTGKIVRPVVRFVASVLITSGVLMLLDAALTVTWQEPVSAFIAARQQSSLEGELDMEQPVLDRVRTETAKEPDPRKRVKKLAVAWGDHVKSGDAVGRIDFPTLDRKYVVVQGTTTSVLRKGPGHYPDTTMPGEGGTVAIAGHRTTYGAPFRTIDKLKKGQPIVVTTPYGKLTYEVEKTQIVAPTALWVTDRVPGAERLVLSACHPLYGASERLIAFARLESAELR